MANRFIAICAATALSAFFGCTADNASSNEQSQALRSSLTFYASFDSGTDADFAKGNSTLYYSSNFSDREERRSLTDDVEAVYIKEGAGKYRDALYFTKNGSGVVYYEALDNMWYADSDWSGTVSLWLSLDPDSDLAPGYSDPMMITSNSWNDAAFFIEFSRDETPREFRLGAYADYEVWNPDDRQWSDIPFHELPLVSVKEPPFDRDAWTHVVFTFDNFNTGENDGVARLYLNGDYQGSLNDRTQTFTWNQAESAIGLGINYSGLIDELSIFDRALNESEIKILYELNEGVAELM